MGQLQSSLTSFLTMCFSIIDLFKTIVHWPTNFDLKKSNKRCHECYWNRFWKETVNVWKERIRYDQWNRRQYVYISGCIHWVIRLLVQVADFLRCFAGHESNPNLLEVFAIWVTVMSNLLEVCRYWDDKRLEKNKFEGKMKNIFE